MLTYPDALLDLPWPQAAATHRAHFCEALSHGDEDAAVDALGSVLISEAMATLQASSRDRTLAPIHREAAASAAGKEEAS